MRPIPYLLAGSMATLLCGVASAQATLTDIGGNAPRPTAMSADGAWVAGYDFNGGFRWSSGTGFDTFTASADGTPDIANNGALVAITLINGNGDAEAGLWSPSGTTFLGGLGSQSGTSVSSAWGCNDDGSVVVGLGWVTAGQAHAFKWTQATGMVDLLSQNPTRSSRANGVSGDGTLVVGWDEDLTGFRRAAIWPGGVPTWISANPSECFAANTDGSVVVGIDSGEAFRWTQGGGLVSLGKLPGSVGADDATAVGVSDDGNTIVGYNGNAFFGTPYRAFIWRPGAGMVVLKDLLVALGAPGASSATLSAAMEVSADGKTIVIQSGQAPFGPFKAYVATLPDSATTYCTSQTNSQGCTPTMTADGTPSASSGAGFTVSTSQVLPGVPGMLIYGTNGAASLPYNGGTLCVAAPVHRTPLQNSAGSGTCGGSFSMDFNAFVATSGDPALVGGAQVWAQYWSRDTGSAGGTNLTDGLTFTLWP